MRPQPAHFIVRRPPQDYVTVLLMKLTKIIAFRFAIKQHLIAVLYDPSEHYPVHG